MIKDRRIKTKNVRPYISFLLFTVFFLLFPFISKAQSINENYPTPITGNEINGKIVARDIGDARLTSYFYVFNGNQGDVFINVQTSNFNGDIDVFTADNLKPLTKITIYADLSENETGRVIYLRKPEKLILRIEGRSPNDDAAAFKIKFAGTFAAMTNVPETVAPEAPQVKNANQSKVRVNSVGTIIEVKPKPTPTPKETIAKIKRKPEPKKPDISTENKGQETERKIDEKVEKTDVSKNETADTTTIIIEKKPTPEVEKPVETSKPSESEVIVANEPAKSEVKNAIEEKTSEETKPEVSAKITIKKTPESAELKTVGKKSKSTKKTDKPKEPNPLENIRLIVLFKDGSKIERPMSDVLKVSVDKGILTVISKGGAIGRYSILEVAKMTIE